MAALTSFTVKAYIPCQGRCAVVLGSDDWNSTCYLQGLASFSPARKVLSSKDEIVVASDVLVRRVMVSFMLVSDGKRLFARWEV